MKLIEGTYEKECLAYLKLYCYVSHTQKERKFGKSHARTEESYGARAYGKYGLKTLNMHSGYNG